MVVLRFIPVSSLVSIEWDRICPGSSLAHALLGLSAYPVSSLFLIYSSRQLQLYWPIPRFPMGVGLPLNFFWDTVVKFDVHDCVICSWDSTSNYRDLNAANTL